MALTPVLNPSAEQQSPTVAAQPTAGEILARRLRVWGIRSVLSVVDQGLTAAVGFGVNVLLARWLAPDAYGAYAVAFAGFLFVSGFHNVLLLEPLTVIGPSNHPETLTDYFRTQVKIHALLVGGLSVAILAASFVLWSISPRSSLLGAVFGSALALPFLLLLWLVRRMCYVLQRPSLAVFSSSFYLCFVVAGLFLLHYFHVVTPFTAFALTGSGSLLAGCVLLYQLRRYTRDASGDPLLTLPSVLRENWGYGRWLVGSTVLGAISTQTQTFLVAGTIGLGSAGILRAMQIPALVMVQIVAAASLLVLPAFSYDFGRGLISRMRHKAFAVSASLAAAILAFAGLLVPLAARTERLLYGGKYAQYAWLMPVLVLIPATLGLSSGCSMALRASHQPKFDLIAQIAAAPVAVTSAVLFIRWWGLAGAAASLVLGYLTHALVTCLMYRRSALLRRESVT